MSPARGATVLLVVVSVSASAPRKQGAFLAVDRAFGGIALGSEAAAADAREAADTKELGISVAKAALALQQASTVLDEAGPTSQNATANISSARKQQLTAELTNLRAVYDTLKKGIVRGNTHEGESKKDDTKRVQDIEGRLAKADSELNATNASAPQCDADTKRRLLGAIVEETHVCFRRALLTNQTKADRVELAYWEGHRESSHSMFHSQLKMAHGMMDRIKQLTDVYESVIAGKKLDENKIAHATAGLPIKKAIAAAKPVNGVAKPAANSSAPKLAAKKDEVAVPKKPESVAPKPSAQK